MTAGTTLLGIGSNLTLVNYNTLPYLPNLAQYATTTNLNLQENALTFSSPLIRTTNTISFNISLISYNDLANKPTLIFLQLTGGTLTGQLILSTASGNNPLYITSTSTTANNCIQIKTILLIMLILLLVELV